MSCFNDIFAMHIFASCCVTVVSHTLLFDVRAPSWRAQLSHKLSNTMHLCIRFFVENDQPTVYRHTHTSLVNHAMNTIYLTLMHNFQLGMFQTIWMHDCMVSKYVFVAYDFSNCFSVFQHVFPNCIFQHWMCSYEQVKKQIGCVSMKFSIVRVFKFDFQIGLSEIRRQSKPGQVKSLPSPDWILTESGLSPEWF